MFSNKSKSLVGIVLVIITVITLFAGCKPSSDEDATYECKTSDGTIVFYRHELTEDEKKTTIIPQYTVPTVEGESTTATTVATTVDEDEKAYQYYYYKNDEKVVLETGTYKATDGTIHVISLGFAKGYYNTFKVVKTIAIILAVVIIFVAIIVISYKGVQYEEKQKKAAREKNKKSNKK